MRDDDIDVALTCVVVSFILLVCCLCVHIYVSVLCVLCLIMLVNCC